MTHQEIAIKYGVPMPETCEKLNWHKETLFSWYILQNSKYDIVFTKTAIECNKLRTKDNAFIPKIIPAPQMHEMLLLIPTHLFVGGNRIILESNHFKKWIGYDLANNYCLSDYHKFIKDNHYAQAYAELYLALKEKNLLNT